MQGAAVGPLSAQTTASVSRKGLPANQLAPAAARRFVRAALTGHASAADAGTEGLVDDAVLLTSELVTNAVMYAGTDIDVSCRLERGHHRPPGVGRAGRPEAVGVVIEVVDRHPSRSLRDASTTPGPSPHAEPGYGLQLIRALSEAWGVTYRRAEKAVWFRLETPDRDPDATPPRERASAAGLRPDPAGPLTAEAVTAPGGLARTDREGGGEQPDRADGGDRADWADLGGPVLLAETSELLADQLDQDLVAALVAQLLVPRLADWCGVWLRSDASGAAGLHLSRVWHSDERRLGPLRAELERDPPVDVVTAPGTAWPWPESAGGGPEGGSALAFPLVSQGGEQGMLLLGRAGRLRMTDGVTRTVDAVAHRVAQAVDSARQYTRQRTISRALQRRQLPATLASITGVDTAVVYEPHGEGLTVGGDFYDIFPLGERRWCFLLGDVQGKDPEAMSVTGLARHLVRLLAREGHGVESVLERLNAAMAEESAEALEAGGEQAGPRFLSLLCGEVTSDPGVPGAAGSVASAGHPLPLHLRADGSVVPVSEPQMLLGIDEGAEFSASPFTLAPGEALVCVTDGVTERRCGSWQLDDNDGLAGILRDGWGLGANALAEHVRRVAHDFGPGPVEDDLSVLVLQAVPSATRPRARG
ncbi:SpoIIE family protein phosphatase [Streptomyces sp. NPDC014733]|uniref:SpoIIE family protein phosphatase n=1 Tax=Streptomyces sp. NPDC014733 TaxID=3364885 RepID=UPI0036F90FB6